MSHVPGEEDSGQDLLHRLQPEEWALRLGPEDVLLDQLVDVLLVLVHVGKKLGVEVEPLQIMVLLTLLL